MWMTKAAPDGVIHGNSVVVKTENSANPAKSTYEALFLDVFFADRPTAELTDRIRVFIALDAFHSEPVLFNMLFEDFHNPFSGVSIAEDIRGAGHAGVGTGVGI